MKEYIKSIVFVLVLCTAIYFGYKWDFYVWALEHPNTPDWVYWARGGK